MSSSTESRVLQETTAGDAQASAVGSGPRATEQVNVAFADRATVARDAASQASSQVGGTGLSNTLRDLGYRASAETDAAAAEGKADTQGYLDSARSLAGTAFTTAQSAFSTAQQTMQPHINAAASAAQPHVEAAYNSVRATVEPHLTKARTAMSGGVPPTSAPLETGPHTVDTPYPPVDHPELHARKVGQNQNTF